MPDGFKSVILCDDIRQEKSNKFILIGVFSGDVVVGSFPAIINVSLYAEYFPKQTGRRQFSIRFFADGQQKAEVKGALDVERLGNATLVLPTIPLEFSHEAELQVNAEFEGEPTRTILTKKVIQGTVAS